MTTTTTTTKTTDNSISNFVMELWKLIEFARLLIFIGFYSNKLIRGRKKSPHRTHTHTRTYYEYKKK